MIHLTSLCLLPRRLLSLDLDLLLNLSFFVELVEVVDNDRNGEGDAEHATDRASWKDLGLPGILNNVDSFSFIIRKNQKRTINNLNLIK